MPIRPLSTALCRWGVLLFGLVATPLQATELRVGVSGSPPFVFDHNGEVTSIRSGISVQIWNAVADDLGIDYKLIPQPNSEANLEALASGELDVSIGPLSITSQRVEQPGFDFSQPYFFAEEGVLVQQMPPTLMSRLKPFFGWAALSSVGVLVLSLFVVGNLIWLAERRRNSSQFPRAYVQGVGNSMWFALVTLTTVGYGDHAPISRSGRVITATWMVLSLVAVSSITAGLASAFTMAMSQPRRLPLLQVDDLSGAPLAAVRGTTSVNWGLRYGARVQQAPSLEQAIALLQQDRVEGVIFDRPALRYYLRENPGSGLALAPLHLAKQTYGFAIRRGLGMRKKINGSLLMLHRSGEISGIVDAELDP